MHGLTVLDEGSVTPASLYDTAMDHPPPHRARYHRQTLLPCIGDAGQAAIESSHAIIVGVGATGGAVAELLARAGVGRVTLVDRDLVELTNLQRQGLFDERCVGEPKAIAGVERLRRINSRVLLEPLVMDLTSRSIDRLPLADQVDAPGVRVLLDGTDNYETRFLLNDLAVRESLAFMYAGVIGTRGMTFAVRPGQTPCLRCLFDGPPTPGSQPTCDTAGVLGAAVQMVAAIAASQSMRIMTGDPGDITLTEIDAWTGALASRDISGTRDPHCPCCVSRQYEFLSSRVAETATLCGQHAIQIAPSGRDWSASTRVDLQALRERLASHGTFQQTPFLVRGRLNHERSDDGHESSTIGLTVFADGRAIVDGTERTERARSIYSKYVGD